TRSYYFFSCCAFPVHYSVIAIKMNPQAAPRQAERKASSSPAVILLVLLFLGLGTAKMPGEELKTESRMPFLHHIPLRDADGQIITLPPAFDEQGKPHEAKGNPFSTAQTC